jgi:hypothetical protein
VTTTYIFHVIGTLTMAHVALAAESMGRQRFRWQNLVVHNASTLPLQPILDLMPAGQFDKVQVLDYNPKDPPTCAQDWFKQMRYVCGTDRYFSHKADFYLANGVCEAFDSLPEGDWFVPFHKYDMKSRASIATLREYAALPWEEGLKLSTTGSYQKHLGKLAIPFMQTQGVDGTIHGYTEAARGLYAPSLLERNTRWGVAESLRDMQEHIPFIINDTRFFACHMWHESPDRTDWNKNTSPEERF